MTGFRFRRAAAKKHVAPAVNRRHAETVPPQQFVEITAAGAPERVVCIMTAVRANHVEPDFLFEIGEVAVTRIETPRRAGRAFRRVFRRISQKFLDFGGDGRQRGRAIRSRQFHAAELGRIVGGGEVDPADRAVRADGVSHRWRGRRLIANERFKSMSHNDFRAFGSEFVAEKTRVVSDNHRAMSLVGKLGADGLSYPADRRESKFVGNDGSPA